MRDASLLKFLVMTAAMMRMGVIGLVVNGSHNLSLLRVLASSTVTPTNHLSYKDELFHALVFKKNKAY